MPGIGQRPLRGDPRAAVVVHDDLDQCEVGRNVIVRNRAGRALARPERDVVRALRAADARPRAGGIASGPGFCQRVRAGIDVALSPARAGKGRRSAGGEREVRRDGGSAVVVDDDLHELEVCRDVVVRDRARRALPGSERDVVRALGTSDARPGARRVARRTPGLGERVGAGCARDWGRARGAQRPSGRQRGPAIVVHDDLDELQVRGLVVICDRARRRLAECKRNRIAALRPAHARPRTRGVPRGAAGLGERVRPREHIRRNATCS